MKGSEIMDEKRDGRAERADGALALGRPQTVAVMALLAAFLILVALRLFWRLSAIGLQDGDEAWHITNAYEMFRDGRWLINTCRGEVDYFNSKPPLSLWPMILAFRVLGVSLFAAKLPSALAGFLICLGGVAFLARRDGWPAALFFAASYLLLQLPYDYHGFRAGDLDAVFILLFALAMLTLHLARRDSRWLICFGFLVGLCLMSKSLHALAPAAVGLCFLPLTDRRGRWRHALLALPAALLPVLPWAVKRYLFDGTTFFQVMVFGETGDKVKGRIAWEYAADLADQPVFQLMWAVLAVWLVTVLAVSYRSAVAPAGEGGARVGVFQAGLSRALRAIGGSLRDNAAAWLWLIVPLVFYAAAGSYSEWYLYPSYPAAALLIGIYGGAVLRNALGGRAVAAVGAALFSAVLLGACAVLGLDDLSGYPLAGEGGGQGLSYWHDIQTVFEKYGEEHRGDYIYIQNVSRQHPDQEVTDFHDDLYCYSVVTGDLVCMEGGVASWLAAEEGLLVLNKDLWDAYSKDLIGYVILQDGSWLIFSHDRYGE